MAFIVFIMKDRAREAMCVSLGEIENEDQTCVGKDVVVQLVLSESP